MVLYTLSHQSCNLRHTVVVIGEGEMLPYKHNNSTIHEQHNIIMKIAQYHTVYRIEQ